MGLDEFKGTTPEFKPEEYFVGRTKAWGFFQDRFGTVRRQFTVDIEGRMEGDTLVMVEQFAYADGERDTRIWRIKKAADGSYQGTADDIVGTAIGRTEGQAMSWGYTFDLKVGGSTWRVWFDDLMLLQPDGVMLNRSTVSKFGITLGEVYLFFQKQPVTGSLDDGATAPRGVSKAAA